MVTVGGAGTGGTRSLDRKSSQRAGRSATVPRFLSQDKEQWPLLNL